MTWTIYVVHDSYALTQLMINNVEYYRAFADSTNAYNSHSSTGFAVASLTLGDTVHVQFDNGQTSPRGKLYLINDMSYFAGWILE